MKKKLLIALFFVSTLAVAQEKEEVNTSFNLKEAQDFAVEHNYKNKKAMLDVDIAKKKVWETTAMGLPQVSANAKLQKFLDIPVSLAPASAFNPAAPADELAELQFGLDYSNSVGISASQLIFDGSYIVGLQAAKTYKNLSISNQIKTEIELREGVKQAYFTVLVAEENTAVLTKSKESVEKILKETSALYKEGMVDEQSVDQLTLSVNELATAVGIAEGQVRFARKLLKLQLGMDIATKITLTENLDGFVDEVKVRMAEKDFNVENHIDYNLVETNMRLQKLNLRKEKYAFLPSINLFLSHEQQNMNTKFDAFSGGKWYPMTVVGAQLTLPILQSGARLSKMSQARIELDKAEITAKEVEQSLLYQTQVAQSNYETNHETYVNQKENMALAKKIYDKTVLRYKEGVASSLELSQTQNQYLTAEGNYIKALLDLLTSKSELQKSYGIK
ncbi:MAG: TolC family protein [Vicingaceae bacterium]|nr:TolC family protein [Vicingaceae bacterium]